MTAPSAPPHFRTGLFREDDGTAHLLASRCTACGALAFPNRAVCASCNSFDQPDIVELSDRGTLYTFAVVRQAPKQFPVPYVIGYVDTDDGVRVFTQITTARPEDLHLGAPMRSVVSTIGDATDARTIYTFRPADED